MRRFASRIANGCGKSIDNITFMDILEFVSKHPDNELDVHFQSQTGNVSDDVICRINFYKMDWSVYSALIGFYQGVMPEREDALDIVREWNSKHPNQKMYKLNMDKADHTRTPIQEFHRANIKDFYGFITGDTEPLIYRRYVRDFAAFNTLAI